MNPAVRVDSTASVQTSHPQALTARTILQHIPRRPMPKNNRHITQRKIGEIMERKHLPSRLLIHRYHLEDIQYLHKERITTIGMNSCLQWHHKTRISPTMDELIAWRYAGRNHRYFCYDLYVTKTTDVPANDHRLPSGCVSVHQMLIELGKDLDE